MGRSGTTHVMEMLDAAGIYLDEVNWAYEHEEARLVNDGYLEQHFGARSGLPYGDLPEQEIVVADPGWRARAAAFVAAMDERAGDAQAWAFKDPRTTILADMWLEHFQVVIGVFRRPDVVTDSYLSQGWIKGWRKRRTVLEYWRRFNESLVRLLDGAGDRYDAHLLEMSNDFPAQITEVCRAIGAPLPDEALSKFDAKRQPPPGPHDVDARYRGLFAELERRRTVPA
jgi:hypothetical protein